MNLELEALQNEERSARHTARRIVVYAALISTIFGLLYLLGLTGKHLVDGTIHSRSAPPVQMVSAAIGLLWDLTLVILFAGLRWQTSRKRAVYADLALVFMALLCATSSINWFVQLAVVPKIAPADAALALIDIHIESSLMYALEHLAWGIFYGLATIFMAVAIEAGKLNTWIRWLFAAGGVLSLLHVLGILIGIHFLIDLGYFAAGVLLPLTTALLVIGFRQS